MKQLKNNWWKVVLIIFVSIFSNILLHVFLSPLESDNISLGEPSIFVKRDMLIPALLVWELITFGIFAIIFLLINENVPGKKLNKGFLYGSSIGGLYLIGMLESTLLFNTTIFSELLMGLPDLISFLLCGTLLGLFIGSEGVHQIKKSGLVIIIVAIFYFIGRYFAYTVLNISSTYSIKPAGTFFWTLGLGVSVGLIFYLVQPITKGKSILYQGILFGVIIFGLNWLMNHVFMFTIIKFELDILIRVGIDIIFTTFGVYSYMKISNKKNERI